MQTTQAGAVNERSYWSDSADIPSFDPNKAVPDKVDVLIVGGGYTGLSAAYELARAGARVAVFEAQSFGWGASSRNGGQVLTGTKLSASALLKRFGAQRARAMWQSSLDAISYIERLIQSENIACDFARSGHLELAWKPRHFTGLTREAETLDKHFGHSVTLIARDDLRAELDSPLYHGGLLDAASAGLHPGRYVAGLVRACERAGVMLYERTPVVDITPRTATQRAHVGTAHGAVRCEQVMLATNGYTGPLSPWLQRRVVPIGSYVIATAPLDENTADAVSARRRMFYDSKNYLYYWRLTADRRLIFGGRAEFVPPTRSSTMNSMRALRRGMLSVYPFLSDVAVEYAWGGTLGFSFDLIPHAGVTPDGVHYAVGCGGHGVAMLSLLGAETARRILGQTVDNPTFALNHPTAPLGLYNGTPWFLPLAGAYYRVLDALT